MQRVAFPHAAEGDPSAAAEVPQQLPRWIYLGIMFGMVIISVVVISANGKQQEALQTFILTLKCFS